MVNMSDGVDFEAESQRQMLLYTGNGSYDANRTIQIIESIVADQLDAPTETPVLKQVHDYLLVILLISVMFSMGCGVTLSEVCCQLFNL